MDRSLSNRLRNRSAKSAHSGRILKLLGGVCVIDAITTFAVIHSETHASATDFFGT